MFLAFLSLSQSKSQPVTDLIINSLGIRNEFAALFSRYGTVSHCVILATVDNSSRRRGFIVMSTHEEAKLAMSELTRTQIKSVSSHALSNGAGLIELGEVRGHTIDVSWAVVQRSQGKY